MSNTFGQFLLNEAIPVGYRPDGAFTKKRLQTAMTRLAKDDPTQYVKTITTVKRLGDEFATMEGISVGLDDIAPMYKERNAIVKPALAAVKAATTRDAKIKIISNAQDQLLQHAMVHPGTMGDMARAGARGNALQLMRAVGAPAASADEKDNIQPWLTVRSYSEGLRPSEWWAANREARMAAVKSNIEVQDPGELSKVLVNNSSDQIITTADCGTDNGLKFSVVDSSIFDRFLAKAAGPFKADTLLAPRVISELKRLNIHDVIVRSPMTCEADAGICQHCMGLNSVGKLNQLGDNVGVRSSQSLGEPLTQMALNAKHGVRMSGQNPMDIGGLEGFRAIIESPASFKNKATLAPVDGVVSSIVKAPQGGHYIKVGTEKVYVLQGLEPIVKVGDHVHAGDTLSEGIPRPDEVVKYKGLGSGREYMIEKLSQIYKNAGIDTDRRHFEVLAKSALNYMHIDDVDDADSADHGLIRGDVIEYNKYRSLIAGRSEEVPLADAENRYLGAAVFQHLAGAKVTPSLMKELRRAGVTHVKVTTRAPTVSPFMSPATRNPLLNSDWMARLGHRYLKQTLLEGAHEGHKSNLHGTHPVPGLVFSSEFGEGSSGRY